MSGKRIGERLSRMVPLSGHDIEEILSEQGSSGRRFGDIALQFGLCMPEHIWRAWSSQLAEAPQRVNLDAFAIDAQAVAHLAPEIVMRFHVMPVRVLCDELVIAVDETVYPQVAKELLAVLRRNVKFVLSDHGQIARAIRSYYPPQSSAA
jgi:hypothetical protein